MKLKNLILWGYVVMATIILFLSAFSIYFIDRLNKASEEILKDNYLSIESVNKLIDNLNDIENSLAVILSKEDIEMEISKNEFYRALNNCNKHLISCEKNITEPGEKELLIKIRKEYENFISIIQKTDPEVSYNFYLTELIPIYKSLKSLCYELLRMNEQAIFTKNENAKRISKESVIYMIIVTGISILLVILIILKGSETIIKPILELNKKAEAISEKKYSERITVNSKNEVGILAESFNKMAEKLSEFEKSNIDKLLAEKKRAEAIVKSMHDGILVLNELNNVILINFVSEELFGVSEKNIIGKNINDIADYNNLIRNISQDLKDDTKKAGENDKEEKYFRISFKEKEEYFLKEIIKVFDEGNKNFLGSIILLKNITGFKELDEIKSGFVSTVSHELRTPLATMSMSLRLLLDKRIGDVNEEQSKLINAMKQEVKRLLKIVNELLDLSKMESGSDIMKFHNVSVDDLIDAAVTPMLMQIEQKKINFKIDNTSSIKEIKADANKIAWVLINLLSNAIRYTPEKGNISVIVSKKENEVIFCVKDTGNGIAPNNLGKIFNKFVQLDKLNIENNKSGVGLGLAISKEFVNAHNGRIWVESEIGKGTSFYFTIPV